MQENKTQLNVSTQVLEKMAQIAACEVEGVTGLSKKAIDIKGTYTELANKALELQELPLLGEEEEACTEGLTE